LLEAPNRVDSPTAALGRLAGKLSELPVGRLLQVADRLGLDAPSEDRAELVAVILEQDLGEAGQRRRQREGWVSRKASREYLLGGLHLGEATLHQLRLEVAFGLHIRPMLALTEDRYASGLFRLPWRCWFDLEPAIDAWAQNPVARRTGQFRTYDPTDDHGRSFVATQSCIAVARTVGGILEERQRAGAHGPASFPFEVATSDESIGVAGHLLERRHRRAMTRHAARLDKERRRYVLATEQVLLDALLLLQPAIPMSLTLSEPPPPPPPLPPSADEDDDWMY
jgi:hypothetical protein